MALIKLPREVLEAIFADVEIVDLASLRGTCGLFNKIIKSNKLLFKKIYLINLVRQVSHFVFRRSLEEGRTGNRGVCFSLQGPRQGFL
jgi:hypothetical protein